MSEFTRRETTAYLNSPTKCFCCGDHEPPFVDTHVELPIHGHVYICAANGKRSGCVRQLARLDGLIDPERVEELQALLAAKEDEIEQLRGLLTQKKTTVAEVLAALEA